MGLEIFKNGASVPGMGNPAGSIKKASTSFQKAKTAADQGNHEAAQKARRNGTMAVIETAGSLTGPKGKAIATGIKVARHIPGVGNVVDKGLDALSRTPAMQVVGGIMSVGNSPRAKAPSLRSKIPGMNSSAKGSPTYTPFKAGVSHSLGMAA